MPFGMVSGVGRGIGVLDGGGDRRRKRDSFGANLGRPIVTNEDFATRLFPPLHDASASFLRRWPE